MAERLHPSSVVAVDIGNSRTKLGLFTSCPESGLPVPATTLEVPPDEDGLRRIGEWLGPAAMQQTAWWVGSVNRPALTRLLAWLRADTNAPGAASPPPLTLLACGDLPLTALLPRPDMVGIDRLLNAVAANRLRENGRPCMVVDLGSAITVDLISGAGEFLGGAILPGIGTSARALHEFTDLLPLLDMQSLAEPPPALGTNTVDAMRAGLYWGAVGGVRELIQRLNSSVAADVSRGVVSQTPQVFLTGGAAPAVAHLLSDTACYVPHLTLGGIAIAACQAAAAAGSRLP